jgi:hypothetical protein
MMRTMSKCSSRKNRKVPCIPAWPRVGARVSEKTSDGLKFMQHNKGLCCTFGAQGGVGCFTSFFCGSGQGKWLRNSEQVLEKGYTGDVNDHH